MLVTAIVVAGICLLAIILIGLILRHALKIDRAEAKHNVQQYQQKLMAQISEQHIAGLQNMHDGLQKGRTEMQTYLRDSLQASSQLLAQRVEQLTALTEQRLKDISGQVERRLDKGFEKTNQTFTDIQKRLALIDQAQQKISELSGNVISLKDLLADKRSRGAFGEVQLTALIRNMLPEQHFSLQHTLSNGKRADCVLFLPEPTGSMVVDAKFPLESYQRLGNDLSDIERHAVQQQFRKDIKKHIQDIATKYIISGETADGAIMFIPAEAIFAEIHAHYPELVQASYQAKVWLTSPTTMMAVLTTIRSVIKDDATRQQMHVIQQHLQALSVDFSRFQKRMNGLQRHIELANKDVQEVNVSARKITARFDKIEQVELSTEESALAKVPGIDDNG